MKNGVNNSIANINAVDNDGNTALHLAACQGTAEECEELLKKGADVNAINNLKNTPLNCALRFNKNLNVALTLIYWNAGVDIRGKYEIAPLHLAAAQGAAKVCEELLRRGADINATEDGGYTALHNARNLETALVLLHWNATVDIREEEGKTPLHIAAERGATEVCEVLLKNGADINAVDNSRNSSLHAAANAEVCEALLKNGADIMAVDKNGRTPLHLASEHGAIETCEALLKRGANINAVDHDGSSPLLMALLSHRLQPDPYNNYECSQYQMIAFLIYKNANLAITNNYGVSTQSLIIKKNIFSNPVVKEKLRQLLNDDKQIWLELLQNLTEPNESSARRNLPPEIAELILVKSMPSSFSDKECQLFIGNLFQLSDKYKTRNAADVSTNSEMVEQNHGLAQPNKRKRKLTEVERLEPWVWDRQKESENQPIKRFKKY